MKAGTILGIITIVAIIGFVYFYFGAGTGVASPNEFGGWNQQVIINYEDGSSTTLELFHDGKEVESILYQLDAKVEGNTPVFIDLSSYSIDFIIGTNTHTVTFSSTPTVPPDGEYHTVIYEQISASVIEADEPDGTYDLRIVPKGTITHDLGTTADIPTTLPIDFTSEFVITTHAPDYTLTVLTSPTDGGTVELDPSGGTYLAGTSVQLRPYPASGYTFNSWTGDLSGNDDPATIVMDANKTVTAVFIPIASQGEDLSTYTIGDPNSVFTISPDTFLTYTGFMTKWDDTYLRTATSITGDLTLTWRMRISELEASPNPGTSGGMVCMALLSVNPYTDYQTIRDLDDEGVCVHVRQYTDSLGVEHTLLQLRNTETGGFHEGHISLDTDYWCKLWRQGTTFYFDAFTDADMTQSAFPSARYVYNANTTTYSYFNPIFSRGRTYETTGYSCSGIIADFIITEN